MTKPHITFCLIAGAGLIWNLRCCLTYVLQTVADVVAEMPEVYQIIINGRPAWATAAFAIAVFAGAVGCILLLLRRRIAAELLVLSLLGILARVVFITMLIGFVPSTALSLLVGIALFWYATIARRKGWLR